MTEQSGQVATRLHAAGLEDRIEQLALAACASDEALAAAADDPAATDANTSTGDEVAPTPTSAAYLTRIEVEGFRGIGPTASLELTAGPGLTLIVGRNGSGKSSLAEAVEFALTGDNARWRSRSKVWRDGWRNLHEHEHSHVRAELLTDGRSGTTAVTRRWDPDAELDGSVLEVEGPDGPSSLDELGWRHGLEVYRPFLPYSELGSMVDEGPTALHDALSTVLGLDELTAAQKRLKDLRLARERGLKTCVAAGKELADDLDALDDDRARTAAEALRARKRPDLATVEELVAGSDPTAERSLDLLRQLAGLRGPDLDRVRAVADELTEAAAEAADHAGTDAARDLQTADLLAAARSVHAEHGDQDCPVCGGSILDDTWAAAAEAREQELRRAAQAVRAARSRLDAARSQVAQLVTPAPGAVERAGVADLDTAAVLQAYGRWTATREEPAARAQASALLTAADELTTALAELRDQAQTQLRIREDAWRPYAARLASWLADARTASDAADIVPELRDAEKAVSRVLDELRTERWAPIAEQARQVWGTLRQRSSVEVEEVALAGTGVRRRVEVQVTVDGVAGAALGVMSQGELHALALSLFLPRATLPESPFRFVVLDDPVQSMDPARVDGLARVLDAVAMERQVLVFTHDDRLPDAVRRLGLPATVVEVSRGLGSHVEVRPIATPWQRHLDDAFALAKTDGVPDKVRRDVVPGFCRMALEAACMDLIRARELGSGRTHEDVEVALAGSKRLLSLLALTLFGDGDDSGGRVYQRLDTIGPWATAAVKACNTGAHTSVGVDPLELTRSVERLIRQLST